MCLELCRDEAAFSKSMMGAIEEKFHIGKNLTFAFIDSWAKHPMNVGDQQQQDAFARETNILWNFALSKEEFVFKSIQDVLDENQKLKAEVEYLNENIDYILEEMISIKENLANQQVVLTEAGKDITSLRIESSKHGEEIDSIEETLISYHSQFEIDESRISTNEVELSSHRSTLDDILRNVNDHQLGIDSLSQTSASHQTSIEELVSTTRNLDRLPLGTIMSYHPKNAETFPMGWLPCDGSSIDKGPLIGETTPGNLL